MKNLDLSEYYDSEYTESESECSSSEDETENEEIAYGNNVPRSIFYGQAFNSDPISALNEIFGQIDINNLDLSAEYSTDLTSSEQ
jgi:hypothetical protein